MGKAILFHIIAGKGIIKIRYSIGINIFFVWDKPKKKRVKPKMIKIIDVLWRKNSDLILPTNSWARPAINNSNPMFWGLIFMLESSERMEYIMYMLIKGIK